MGTYKVSTARGGMAGGRCRDIHLSSFVLEIGEYFPPGVFRSMAYTETQTGSEQPMSSPDKGVGPQGEGWA